MIKRSRSEKIRRKEAGSEKKKKIKHFSSYLNKYKKEKRRRRKKKKKSKQKKTKKNTGNNNNGNNRPGTPRVIKSQERPSSPNNDKQVEEHPCPNSPNNNSSGSPPKSPVCFPLMKPLTPMNKKPVKNIVINTNVHNSTSNVDSNELINEKHNGAATIITEKIANSVEPLVNHDPIKADVQVSIIPTKSKPVSLITYSPSPVSRSGPQPWRIAFYKLGSSC